MKVLGPFQCQPVRSDRTSVGYVEIRFARLSSVLGSAPTPPGQGRLRPAMTARLNSRAAPLRVQLAAHVGEALGDEVLGGVAGELLAQKRLRDGDRRVGGCGPDLRRRLRLGLGDLRLGGAGAALDEILHAAVRLVGGAPGLVLRGGEDVLRLALGLAAARLIVGEHLRGFLAQALRLVELGADALAALVESLRHGAQAADLPQDRGEDEEGDGDPGFGFEEHRPGPYRTMLRSSAASTAARCGASPVSRATIAVAASAAMPRTLVIAAAVRLEIVPSDAAIMVLSSASSAFRLTSASAASASRVS